MRQDEPFKHDLFVSYSHGDFDGSGFLDQHHRPGQAVDPMEALTEQLRAEIGAAGLLTVLMTPQHLRSKWCGDDRIAIARIWPTEDPWPEAFVDQGGEPLVGFTFFDPTRIETRPQPYEWPDPTGAKGPFSRDVARHRLDRHHPGHLDTRGGQLAGRGKRRSRAGLMALPSQQPLEAVFDVELPPPCPGLRPFNMEEWPVFFRRDEMIDEVIGRLIRQHLVVVHGDSGCGKSSLIRAGVLGESPQPPPSHLGVSSWALKAASCGPAGTDRRHAGPIASQLSAQRTAGRVASPVCGSPHQRIKLASTRPGAR